MSALTNMALVTGAAGGIGSAIARRFAAGGWRVAMTDVDPDALERVAAEVPGAVTRAADLRGRAACRDTVDWAAGVTGRLDLLVNAAGIWREGPTEETDEADFDLVIGVNLRATYFMASAAIGHLRATEGLIVNLSSDAGIQGNTGAALYCASKGGVSLLTKALALELAPDGIRVNAICPGDVETPMLAFQAARYGGGDPAAYFDRLLSGYPQGPGRARFIRADEVAALAWFLATDEARPITGANISIDFGYSAGK
jgi:NAD(P)-dependent dehydrogenase (short-subunit alcohol dehydrogenase family)